MKKQIKEIERLDNEIRILKSNVSLNFWLLLIGLTLMIIVSCWNIQSQINDLPKRVCEDVIENIRYEFPKVYNPNNCFPLNYEITCEEGLEVREYSELNKKCIWNSYLYDTRDRFMAQIGKICLIKSTKKVCEVR